MDTQLSENHSMSSDGSNGSIDPSIDHTQQMEIIEDKFSRLKAIHRLQKCIVQQKMHNLMSPISFISGYLELIDMKLERGTDPDKIGIYKNRIEHGVKQVNTILNQLQSLYQKDFEEEIDGTPLHLEMNWMTQLICRQMQLLYPNIRFREKEKSIHVCVDLYVTRLIIINLINNVVKCGPDKSDIVISAMKKENAGLLCMNFETTGNRKREFTDLISRETQAIDSAHLPDDPFKKGIAISAWLTSEIHGRIYLHDADSDQAQLRLVLPLSDGMN